MVKKNEIQENTKLKSLMHTIFVIIGGIIAGYSLEAILLPNRISDGGVTGISIMLSSVTEISLGIFIIVINIPFLFLGYKQMGKTFAIRSSLGILSLSISTSFMHHVPTVIEGNPFLVIVSGGFLLGVGMGIALRNGGALDGTDVLAVLIARKTPFSTSDIIIAINVVIFSCAVSVFGIEGAISSLISYFIATKIINVIDTGLDDSTFVYVVSSKPTEIGDAIQNRLGRSVTYLNGVGGYGKQDLTIINCVINRMEENKIKTIIQSL